MKRFLLPNIILISSKIQQQELVIWLNEFQGKIIDAKKVFEA